MPEKKSWASNLNLRALREKRDKKARARLRKEQDKSIDDLLVQGQLRRAQQLLEMRLAEQDEDVHSRIRLAEIYSQRKQKEEALRHYLRAAEILSEDGFFDKALAVAKSARKLAPKDPAIDALEETILRSKELDFAAWNVRRGKRSEGSAQLSASIELEALWRRVAENDFVQSLAQGQLELLMEAMELVQVGPGEFVVREGDRERALFLVVSGLIQARLDPEGRDLLLRNFGPGQILGEKVLLEREAWCASYRAAHGSQLLRLDRPALQRILDKTKAGRQLLRALSSQQNDQQVAALAASVASSNAV